MSDSFGGAVIVSMDFTWSWGLSPASGSLICQADPSIDPGQDAVLTIGGSTFYGVVSGVVDETNDGTLTRVSFVDQRVKLMWDTVYCLFNRVEIREDNPSTPGIDRQRRYVHILPENWETQEKTYTDAPKTAHEIIDLLFGAPTVNHSWSGEFDPIQENPIHEIDCLSGKKLGNAIQEVTEAQGLLFTLVGDGELFWARKGSGDTPDFDPAITSEYSHGASVSAVDTTVRIVGDRNRYQDLGIVLTPDWNDAYEAFWSEPDWLEEVSNTFGGFGDDFPERARLAAFARKVTVRDYVNYKGDDSFSDFGMWGEVSRMEIPVWVYLQDIVFKAYALPSEYQLSGIPLESLELVEGLLRSVDGSLSGAMTYGSEDYPDSKAVVIVQGQPLSLLDPTKQRVITQVELNRANTEWQAQNRFNLDTRNKVVIFEDATFQSTDLLIFPNVGSDAPASMQAIAVPNANCTVTAANVKGAFLFEAERYFKDFGSGERQGSHYVNGLAKHQLIGAGSGNVEINFADNETADAKSEKIAAGLILGEEAYAAGGFKRNGVTGTELTGSIDRVTVSLNFDDAITEQVEFSKERSQSNFENERDLERKQRSKDLFPGQRNLTKDVDALNAISRITKELKRPSISPEYERLSEVMEKPIGAVDCSVVKIWDASGDAWDAGQPIFLGTDDKPSDSGKRFGGIVIADQASGMIACATQGIVPVRVQGPFKTGDAIGIDDGADADPKKDGKKFIGAMQSPDYSGNDVILAMVHIAKGAVKSPETPFQVVLIPGANEGDDDQIGVISNSHLFNSEDKDTYEENNSDWGLLNDDRTSGGFSIEDLSAGDKIWLEIKLNRDQSIAEVSVRHGSAGGSGAWDEYPDPIAINVDDSSDPYQEYYNQIIAEITDPETDPREGFTVEKGSGESAVKMQVTQLLFTNLIMMAAHTTSDADEPNLPLSVATPQSGPGTDTEGNADEINDGDDIMTPFTLGDLPPRYSFQLFDASDNEGPKVLILDGEVFGTEDIQDHNGHVPEGMGNDDYILPLGNSDGEIWLVIPVAAGTLAVIDPVTIATGETTPDDTDTIKYVRLGVFTISNNGVGDLTNTHCGDVIFEGEKVNVYSFKMLDSSDPDNAKVLVLDGNVVDVDGNEFTPEGMGNDEYVRAVEDDDAVFMTIFYNRETGQIIPPVTLGQGTAPEDSPGQRVVEIGYVNVDTSGDKPVVIPHNTLCGDYLFELDDGEIGYSFQMLDATETIPLGGTTYKVRILDGNVIDQGGNEHMPSGMGEDEFIIVVQDNWIVYLEIPRDNDWNITGPVLIHSADEMPSDDDTHSYIQIGSVNVDSDGELIIRNSLTDDFDFEPPPNTNRYAFELIDASDDEAKVLIMDGQVYGPNDDGTLPDGMGGDNFILGVNDGDEIYLIIVIDKDSGDVEDVSIGQGDTTPEDTEDNTSETKYATIGYISIATSLGGRPVVHPTNAICGDYILPTSLDVTGQDDEGEDTNFDHVTQINFLGAASVHHDPNDVNPNAVDVAVGPDVEDEDDNHVDNPIKLTFIRGSKGDDSDPLQIVEEIFNDHGQSEANIYIPVPDVGDESGNLVESVAKITLKRGWKDTSNPDDIVEDNGDNEAVAHLGGVNVSEDINDGFVQDTNELHFQWSGPDDDIDAIVEDDGEGGALINLLKLDVLGEDGPGVAGAIQLTFVTTPVPDGGNIVEEGDSREAVIHIGGKIDVLGDEGGVDNANAITFVGVNAIDNSDGNIVVDPGGENEAVVSVPIVDNEILGDWLQSYVADGNLDEFLDGFLDQWLTDNIGPYIDDYVAGGGLDEFLDGFLDQWLTDNLSNYLGDAIQEWFDANFDIEDYVADVDVDVCVDGSPDSITLFGPLGG